jgi:osmotically-inducible protein OsmY
MKKINLAIATFAVLATMSIANAKQTDKQIHDALDTKMNAVSYLDNNVSFSVKEGCVTLRGDVDTVNEKNKARILAEATPGVMKVENLIHIK